MEVVTDLRSVVREQCGITQQKTKKTVTFTLSETTCEALQTWIEVSDKRVRPGISATVEVPIETAKNATSILLSAVFNDEGVSHIYVKKPAGWERREVSVGINNLQHVEIRSGLEEGEVVALSRPRDFRRSDG